MLRPFGTVNPLAPDWEEDLRRCAEVHGMPGIRLFPGYHFYKLEDEIFARVLAAAARQGLLVQITLAIEDDRSPTEVAAMLRALGYETVWKDWDPSYDRPVALAP